MRVVAAMSGGVDSAVAAALAVAAGHQVVGVHMALSRAPGTLRTGSRGCCTVEDAFDARRVCDLLGIPFYVWDFSEDFAETVIDDFLAEYAAGRTPNPCLRCNEKIKFAALLDRAVALGFDAVCTGHYARIVDRMLMRSADAAKDQSYVLAVLTPDQVQHSIFPLGGMTKDAVRAEAARRGFAVAAKPDSYDICFIPEGDTHGYLVEKLGAHTGSVVDAATGQVVGEHDGYFSYTIGQRKGLGLTRPAPDGRPRYVLGIEPLSGTVTVGSAEDLDVWWMRADRVVFPSGPVPPLVGVGAVREVVGPSDGEVSGDRAGRWTVRGRLQVRAHAESTPVTATFDAGGLVLDLDAPIRAVAPGQSAVLYDESDTVVLAAGTIVQTGRVASGPPGVRVSVASDGRRAAATSERVGAVDNRDGSGTR